MHTLILGAGYSGLRIASQLAELGTVCGTRRSQAGLDQLAAQGISGCLVDGQLTQPFRDQLANTTHLVVSVAPSREPPLQDPMLSLIGDLRRDALPCLQWIGYLSTIGVYGDHQGNWVDEQSPCVSTQPRSLMRREAELAWQSFASALDVPVSVLRLSGIYGPGRNAIEDALQGKARILIKPEQVFNRIHVHDLAQAVRQAARLRHSGILNITDDLPAPPQDVVRYAHELVARPAPAPIDFDTADISPMARSFYSENKRVSNQAGKDALQLQYRYPDYKVALQALWAEKRGS